ncbi:MAG: hypothetical protein IPI58_03635 [Alphaproteobacteria bacterium]|nr:MAG: hypothetical protein IPI58_03635 [Alphaproteobacteria bacterium]
MQTSLFLRGLAASALVAVLLASAPAGAVTPASGPPAQTPPAVSGELHAPAQATKPQLTPEQEKQRQERRAQRAAKKAERVKDMQGKFAALPAADQQKIKAIGEEIKALSEDHRALLMFHVYHELGLRSSHGRQGKKGGSGWRDHKKMDAPSASAKPAAPTQTPASVQ